MIIEILLISLVEDCIISCSKISWREVSIARALIFKMAGYRLVYVCEEEINTIKENVIAKGTKNVATSRLSLFKGKISVFLNRRKFLSCS